MFLRQIVFPKPYVVEVREEPLPSVGADQLLVKTEYSLISPGTELALYMGTHAGIPDPNNIWAKYPFSPGYAVVGRIEAAGEGIQDFKVGDRVFAIGRHASHNVFTISLPEESPVFALPDHAVAEQAIFARLAGISATALTKSKVGFGSKTVILGMGLIGQFAAQIYALMGAEVIAVDPLPGRLEAALRSGIRHVVQSDTTRPLAGQLTEALGGSPADIVVEATGIPDMVNDALELVRPQGQVVLLGSPRGPAQIKTYEHIHSKGVFLTGAHEKLQWLNGYAERNRIIRCALDWIAGGKLITEPLLTHVLAASEAGTAYERLIHEKDQTMGVLFDWRE